MKTIFLKIRQWLGLDPAPYSLPCLGLSESDVKELARFKESEGFDAFTRLLDVSVNIYAEQLIAPQCRDAAALHEIRGVIIGLRKAASLVVETIQQHERNHDADRGERDARSVLESRSAVLYGTPGWSSR